VNYRKSRRARVLAATVTAAGVGLVALGGAPATSAAAPAAVADSCPPAFPQDSLVPGQGVEGRTVSSGTDAEAFTGTYLETIEDGIAPGVDMIMMELHSPAIDKAGGIWAGMSGSPVYDPATGQLIGAVAYGLSWGPSPIAGITPASHMRALLSNPPGVRDDAAATPKLSPKVQAKLVASGTLSKSQARSGIGELGIPFAVSGVSQRRIDQLGFLLGGRDVYRAGGAAATADQPIPVDEAGDNLAATLSTGTTTLGGVGTATLVCGNEVVGFGHPLTFGGRSTFGLSGASAVYIQPDPVSVPFKVANPGATVGTVDQDRLTGIRGAAGPPPATYPITSSATSPDTAGVTKGLTNVSVPDWFSDIAGFHLFAVNDKALDRIGAGSATATWTVTGKHRNGKPFSYTDSDVYADDWDISAAPVWDVLEQLYLLQDNASEKVTLTGLTAETSFGDDAEQWSIGRVYWKVDGDWKRITGKVVPKIKAGTSRSVRVELYSRTDDRKFVVVPVKVAQKAKAKRSGWVTITGGNSAYDLEDFEDWYESDFGGSKPQSVADQIKRFEKRQKNNELRTSVWTPKVGTRSTDKTLKGVVNGEVSFRVVVR
jgi:hypothetical protein